MVRFTRGFKIIHWMVIWCQLYVLATYKVKSGRVPTCNCAHSWRLYSAVSLGHQTAGTMACYPIQSHYPDTDPTSPCPILIISSAWLGNNKYQCLWFDLTRFQTHELQIGTRDLRIGDYEDCGNDDVTMRGSWYCGYRRSFANPAPGLDPGISSHSILDDQREALEERLWFLVSKS